MSGKVSWAVVTSLLIFPLCAWGQTSMPPCGEFKKAYQPQSSPEQTYRLELDMMKQGVYCYDLPIFDPEWQANAPKNAFNENFKRTAQFFDVPYKVYQEGKYAVLYYPGQKTLGPVFLYRENGNWILDRSSVARYIHYGQEWMAYGGDYPYLELLKKIFPLEEGTTASGQKAYRKK